MITKKVILSLVALAGFSAAAVAQLIPPPNNGPGGQRPAPPTPPHCHPLQWQTLCTANKFPASHVAGIAASTDTGDFVAVASDNSGNDYSTYLLQGNNLTQGWTKLTTFSDFNFARIFYRSNLRNNSNNGFRMTGRDLNGQPSMMLSFDNGSNWQQAQFVGVGSDYFCVGSDAYDFEFTNNAGAIRHCGVGSDALNYRPLVGGSVFTAVAHNSNDFVAVASDGSTYVAPYLPVRSDVLK